MQKNLDEVLELIINGEMSIRKASREYGYGRDFLKSKLIKNYGQTPEGMEKIEKLMSENKANSTAIKIDPVKLESVFLRTISREITVAQACEELGGIDSETLKSKFTEYTKNLTDPEILKKYQIYRDVLLEETKRIQHINFRVLAIDMIRTGSNQSYLARCLGISPRTISREFEKLSLDEDTALYDLVKFYNDRTMKKKPFTQNEKILIDKRLIEYEQRHIDLLVEVPESKTEIIEEKMKFLVSEEAKLKEEGLTQDEIAKKLGTSVSGLRRARIFCSRKTQPESEERD